MQPELTESVFDYTYDPFVRRRKDMLPWWIKVGCWFFLVTGILSAVIYPIAILLQGNLWFYNIDMQFLSSWAAVFDFCDGMLKMVTAYGLLKEKDWAIKLGLVQGSLTLALSLTNIITHTTIKTASGIGQTTGISITFIIVICYLAKLYNIKSEWEADIFARQQVLNPQDIPNS